MRSISLLLTGPGALVLLATMAGCRIPILDPGIDVRVVADRGRFQILQVPDETTDEELERFLWFLRSRIEWDLFPRPKSFWDVTIFRASEGVTARIWARNNPAEPRGARLVDRVAAYYYGSFYFSSRWSWPELDDLGVIGYPGVEGHRVVFNESEGSERMYQRAREITRLSSRPPKAPLWLDVPDSTWVPIYFEAVIPGLDAAQMDPSRGINARAAAGGLTSLQDGEFAQDDVEARIWIGFGRSWLKGFVIGRKSDVWSAVLLPPMSRPEPQHNEPVEPRSGWDSMWARLIDEDLLILPDSSKLEGPARVADGVGYVVELRIGNLYRTYLYSNPEYQPWPEAEKIQRIINILDEELGTE